MTTPTKSYLEYCAAVNAYLKYQDAMSKAGPKARRRIKKWFDQIQHTKYGKDHRK